MVLGAGVFQLPLVLRAMARGLFVLTVDNIPGNVAHAYSSASLQISTVDAVSVLRAARRARPNGIMTFASDAAAWTVALVARQLQRFGPPVAATGIMTHKGRWRQWYAAHGGPPAVAADRLETLLAQAERIPFPAVVKPAQSSGSRGISLVATPEKRLLARAFQRAAGASRDGTVCLEPYIAGSHHSLDGILHSGQLIGWGVTDKYLDQFKVLGHLFPSRLPRDARQAIAHHVQQICAALGYHEGAVDADIVWTNQQQPVIVELSPRLGGNGVPELVEQGSGIPLIDWAVQQALGRDPETVPAPTGQASPPPRWASVLVGSPHGGILRRVAGPDRFRLHFGDEAVLRLRVGPGDRVPTFRDGGSVLGYALVPVAESVAFEQLCRQVHDALAMEVETMACRIPEVPGK